MTDFLHLMPYWAFALALGVTFAAGFVKGAVGFAMPLIMISGLSMFLEPQHKMVYRCTKNTCN